MTNYRWKGYNGTHYSENSGEIGIKINSVNDPPTVVDSKINVSEDQIIYFKNVDFTQNFIDVDND